MARRRGADGGGGGGARGPARARAAERASPRRDRGLLTRPRHGPIRGGPGGALHGAHRGRAAVQRHSRWRDQLRPDRPTFRGRRAGPIPLVRRPQHQGRRAVHRDHLLRRGCGVQALPPLLLRRPAAVPAHPAPPSHTQRERQRRQARWISRRRRGVAIMGRISSWSRKARNQKRSFEM